jgi:hypothetical protein
MYKKLNAQSSSSINFDKVKTFFNKKNSCLIISFIICFTIGYFAGREHLKYEMRSAIRSAANEFTQKVGAMFGGNPPKSMDAPQRPIEHEKDYPIKAVLVKKGFYEGEYGQNEVTFTLSFLNSTGKNVRAFDGTFVFTDLLGNTILRANLAVNDLVHSGQSFEWDGSIDYNQFMASHKNLRFSDINNMKTKFELRRVLFDDDSIQNF